MKNLTITVDEPDLEWARVEAARRGTSVSRLVGSFITEMRRRDDAYSHAYEAWKADTRTWVSDGAPYPAREQTCERGESA
jgi:hypothetical protein